jgi:hypothetical protein
VYAADAYVWHGHRQDLPALRRQIFNYSKGHVAYHLLTLLRCGDRRALLRLLYELPLTYLWRIGQRLLRRSHYPFSLIWLEALGNLLGPLALYQASQRVRRQGRSAAYVSVEARQSQPQPQSASL